MAKPDSGSRQGFWSANESRRAAERFYLFFFLISLPFQALVITQLSFKHPNDVLLTSMGTALGVGTWFGPLIFRAASDRGRPFYQLYGFKFGCFLAVWAMVGGYLGTAPWYSVLHGHFGFNTDWNPNGVPLFMLPMTIAVFGLYTVILGGLFRVLRRGLRAVPLGSRIPDPIARALLIVPLAVIIPLGETAAYTSHYYCFDGSKGKWWLNLIVYGAWQAAGLIFYTRLDEEPGESQPMSRFIVSGFAVVGILLFANQITTEFVAPHFTTVDKGANGVDDWSAQNCLGPKPS